MVDAKKIGKESKVLVIGDLILEIRITGTVNRFSKQDLVPVVDFDGLENVITGITINGLNSLRKEGIDFKLITTIGPGKEGEIVINKMNRAKTKSDFLIFDDKVTITDVRVFDKHSGRTISLIEKRNKTTFTDEQTDNFLNKIEQNIIDEGIKVIVYYASANIPDIRKQLDTFVEKYNIEIVEG